MTVKHKITPGPFLQTTYTCFPMYRTTTGDGPGMCVCGVRTEYEHCCPGVSLERVALSTITATSMPAGAQRFTCLECGMLSVYMGAVKDPYGECYQLTHAAYCVWAKMIIEAMELGAIEERFKKPGRPVVLPEGFGMRITSLTPEPVTVSRGHSDWTNESTCRECGSPENAHHRTNCVTATFIQGRAFSRRVAGWTRHDKHLEGGYCAHIHDKHEAWCLREAEHTGLHFAVGKKPATNPANGVYLTTHAEWDDEDGAYTYHDKDSVIFGYGSPRVYVHRGDERITVSSPRTEFATVVLKPGDTVKIHGRVEPLIPAPVDTSKTIFTLPEDLREKPKYALEVRPEVGVIAQRGEVLIVDGEPHYIVEIVPIRENDSFRLDLEPLTAEENTRWAASGHPVSVISAPYRKSISLEAVRDMPVLTPIEAHRILGDIL